MNSPKTERSVITSSPSCQGTDHVKFLSRQNIPGASWQTKQRSYIGIRGLSIGGALKLWRGGMGAYLRPEGERAAGLTDRCQEAEYRFSIFTFQGLSL